MELKRIQITKQELLKRLDEIYKYIDFENNLYKAEIAEIYNLMRIVDYNQMAEMKVIIEKIDDLYISVIKQ
jgi:hypothetical protein